jgi:hypothetical protein
MLAEWDSLSSQNTMSTETRRQELFQRRPTRTLETSNSRREEECITTALASSFQIERASQKEQRDMYIGLDRVQFVPCDHRESGIRDNHKA